MHSEVGLGTLLKSVGGLTNKMFFTTGVDDAIKIADSDTDIDNDSDSIINILGDHSIASRLTNQMLISRLTPRGNYLPLAIHQSYLQPQPGVSRQAVRRIRPLSNWTNVGP